MLDRYMPLLARRYIQAVTGITMIGIGVAFNYMANLGLGPWGVLHDGISKTIDITYGQAGIMTSLISSLSSRNTERKSMSFLICSVEIFIRGFSFVILLL